MAIVLDNITYTYGMGTPFEKTALHGISLTIENGEFLGVIGHTGSGKSTFVQHLNGLLEPTSGRILVDDIDITNKEAKLTEIRKKIGLVFQYPEYQLFEETIEKDIENNELFKEGLFTIQDISSMMASRVLNPKENSNALDVCSAPGGKTTHIATLMNNTGKVISRDVFEHKLKLINNTVNRLGLTNVEVENFDASILDENSINKFDYVLADVPCSGLGIIRRKPEIKYKSKAEIKDLPVLQRKILENASKYVKVGGSLLYSTCTILDSENIEVINNFLKENDNFELVPIDEVNVDLDNQEKGYLKIYPNIHGMDGFFIAKLKRVR